MWISKPLLLADLNHNLRCEKALKILVTGATGYVGGRLVPRLLELGHELLVLVRNPDNIKGRPWSEEVTVIRGDLLDPESFSLPEAIDVAYYLVHSMAGSADFAQQDANAARCFLGKLSKRTHLVYLGGIAPEGSNPSKHLASRIEVGEILSTHENFTEFRAGPIIGSGSASFEMVRNLTERLPVMIAPKWVNNYVRPIAVRDMLAYLLQAADTRPVGSYDIGGEPLRFIDMMLQWAAVRNLRRMILPVPVLAPWLAARWVGLVTPIPNRIAVPLVKGMLTSIVGDTSKAKKEFPTIHALSYSEAVKLAKERIEKNFIETRWSGALGNERSFILEEREGIIHETRSRQTKASCQSVFQTFSAAGGENGWFAWNWAWKLRGFLDRLIGGPGIRRGRRDPEHLLPGEAIDFWRVEEVIPNERIRLRAEMKVPGKAWLEWSVEPDSNGGSRLTQTAFFNPNGISGRLYWILLYPIHGWIFSDMIREIVRRAERNEAKSLGH